MTLYLHCAHTVDAYLTLLATLTCPSCKAPLDDLHDDGLLTCPTCRFTEGDCPRCHAELDDYPPLFPTQPQPPPPLAEAAVDASTTTCLACNWPRPSGQ